MTEEKTRDELLALLDWQRMMGADTVVADFATNWLEKGAAAPGAEFAWPAKEGGASEAFRPAPSQKSAPSVQFRSPMPSQTPAFTTAPTTRPQTPLAPSAAETEARRIATGAPTLQALEKALTGFDGCALKATAKNLCFYRGAPEARLMLIGEAPGREEDLEGKPFVGRAGQLLDKMLGAIALGEADVHITNIVYWRPPGNRTPTPQEALACRPFLERQIELVKPEFILVLGGAAAKEVLGVSEGIMRLRGKWRDVVIGDKRIPALATLHPAYLLRTPAAKGLAWQDLLSLRAKLQARA